MARQAAKTTKKSKMSIRDGVSLFQYMSINKVYDIELHDNTKGNSNGWFTSGNQSGMISQKLTSELKSDEPDIDLSTLKVGKFDTTDPESGKPTVGHMLYQGGTKHSLGNISLKDNTLSFGR